ncbi:cathepsin propeptide inhibitor domain (I29) domain-containing protein [Phthorimaea operculella]|nr:cathepsin propeptide inhibitor domain (I29) domain-containing protein [Phthorimaea operculella]
MQCLIPILAVFVYFVTIANCREFRDYDSDPDDDVSIKPHYDLKDAPQLFEKFIQDYSKTYKSERIKMKHFEIFKKNLEEIIRLNAGEEGKTATFDINLFSDMESWLADDDDEIEEEKRY